MIFTNKYKKKYLSSMKKGGEFKNITININLYIAQNNKYFRINDLALIYDDTVNNFKNLGILPRIEKFIFSYFQLYLDEELICEKKLNFMRTDDQKKISELLFNNPNINILDIVLVKIHYDEIYENIIEKLKDFFIDIKSNNDLFNYNDIIFKLDEIYYNKIEVCDDTFKYFENIKNIINNIYQWIIINISNTINGNDIIKVFFNICIYILQQCVFNNSRLFISYIINILINLSENYSQYIYLIFIKLEENIKKLNLDSNTNDWNNNYDYILYLYNIVDQYNAII